ncbi:MAG: acetyl-CoA carboxylase, carboxyltransferase subunit beta [Hyphomicrobiaceae bacterium]|nr:acetyl-CoA carboxylase carboxyltransferase subunit beta [Hyphomicrobiaceae bacterium]
MNWINNVVRPKIRGLLTTRREPPDNFWHKCGGCGQMSDVKALEENAYVFPCCGHHERMASDPRLKLLFDDGAYTKVPVSTVPTDPLKFRDGQRYTDRLKAARAKTALDDAVVIAEGKLDGQNIVTAVQDFRFMGGSLGMAAGEAIVTGMLHAVAKKAPFILFAASGGARMQEGILSLMQMPRTTIAVQRLRDARLPYIVVLTDPTTGGVTASYAMLGDVHIAEPGALICFAGPRVIEQTIREQLPEGFQRAEYLLAHGMVDMVVHRHKMRETLSRLCRITMSGTAAGVSVYDGGKKKPAGYIKSMNGHAVDGKVVEKLARGSDILEPEPVEDGERFDAARIDAREKAKREADAKAKSRTFPPNNSRS